MFLLLVICPAKLFLLFLPTACHLHFSITLCLYENSPLYTEKSFFIYHYIF